MKMVDRAMVAGAMACAVIGAVTLIGCSSTGKVSATEQQAQAGQWADPALLVGQPVRAAWTK